MSTTPLKFICTVFALFVVCVASTNAQTHEAKPEYVFLFIGDGMGELHAVAAQQAYGNVPFNFQKFPVIGYQQTAAANRKITDSAASGTAFACGCKTNNGMLGQTPEGKPADSIATLAHNHGWNVGIVSSATIDHATPAAFYAHVAKRNEYKTISQQMLHNSFEFMGGAGLAGLKIKSQKDLDKACAAAGVGAMYFANSVADLKSQPSDQRVLAYGAGPYVLDVKKKNATLADLTAASINQLKNKPFFMMVEGAKVDWGGHYNDLAAVVTEVEDMAQAIDHALAFAKKHPNKTLIVVTADHETGGLKTIDNPAAEPAFVLKQKQSAASHGYLMKRLIKEKASFEKVLESVKAVFGFQTITDEETTMLQRAWQATLEGKRIQNIYGKATPITGAACNMVAYRAGYQFTTGGHTAVDVPVYATGVGREKFEGRYQNTEIFNKLNLLMLKHDVVHLK